MALDTNKVREAFDRFAPARSGEAHAPHPSQRPLPPHALLAARGALRLTGADISPVMIRIAKEKSCDPRLTLIAGDIEMLPPAHETAGMFPPRLSVDTVVDSDRCYIVSGTLAS